MFLILNILTNYKVIWENVEFNIPLNENTHQYYDLPKAKLYDGNKLICENPVYEKGVNHTTLKTVTSKHVKEHKIDYRATFLNYNIKSTQTIYFNIVDVIPPEFIRIPNIERTLNSKKLTEREIIETISYKDNYYENDKLILIITGLDGVDIKTPGKYKLTYELIDPSHNITKREGYYIVKNNIAPKIIYDDIIYHEVNKEFIYSDYFKITDEFDKNVKVDVNDFNINYNKIGNYPIIIRATNKDGLKTEVSTYIKVVDRTTPYLLIKPNNVINVYEYDESYLKDIIIEVSDNYDLLTKDDVKIEGYINFNEIAVYNLVYSVSDKSNNIKKVSVKIEVKDLTKPNAVPKGDLIYEVFTENIIWENEFIFSDNYDDSEDLKIKINSTNIKLNKVGNYYIDIEVTDLSKNTFNKKFPVLIVDLTPPKCILIDEIVITDFKSQNINFYKSFFDISDNYDLKEDISLKIESNINYNKIGEYEATFIFKDKSDNQTIIKDYIYLIDINNPEIELKTNVFYYYINDSIPNLNTFILNYKDEYNSKDELSLEIIENINYKSVGLYKVYYYVYDQSKNYSYQTLNFYVDIRKDNLIKGEDIYVNKNDVVNYYNYLTLSENVDKLESYPNTVDTSKPGIKEVLHIAYDIRGNKTEYIQKIYINDKFELSKYKKNIIFTIIGISGLISYIIYYKKTNYFDK